MDRDEKLKLDYEQTVAYYHHLADSRFKLLALVPIVTGAAIGLLSEGAPPVSVLAIGVLGFVVTIGLFFYNQRNTQIFDTMILRAKMLEILLKLESLDDRYQYAGPFLSRPQRNLRLFGTIRVWSDRGLAMIYGAALGGWAFLITNSILQIANKSSPLLSTLMIGIPVIVAIAFIWQVHAWDKETENLYTLPPKIQKLMEVEPKKR
ncbi:MAG TPA: hypothetical protein VK249_20100 [Anaerolineales bacterium]|nr:hypothetical protein [Anaerolineales bacterium]